MTSRPGAIARHVCSEPLLPRGWSSGWPARPAWPCCWCAAARATQGAAASCSRAALEGRRGAFPAVVLSTGRSRMSSRPRGPVTGRLVPKRQCSQWRRQKLLRPGLQRDAGSLLLHPAGGLGVSPARIPGQGVGVRSQWGRGSPTGRVHGTTDTAEAGCLWVAADHRACGPPCAFPRTDTQRPRGAWPCRQAGTQPTVTGPVSTGEALVVCLEAADAAMPPSGCTHTSVSPRRPAPRPMPLIFLT